jgi:cytoskeletal protein CcmA (bactofilin family)
MTATAAIPPAELHIDGHAKGSIQYAGSVRVGPQSVVTGDIRARTIVVEGEVNGDLVAEQLIQVGACARVHGDLQAPRVAMVRGAWLHGRITMRRRAESGEILDSHKVEQVLAGNVATQP